uniref:Transmembrane protein n=1 Tax=Chromera velia CCMP2878 TaxID=1169474 RepID=A0A0G4H2D5_9ALVE|eukprot:Cvel_24360.t1-p1 / transcript=Cvel_24360.t1 / gene=Cvel_24360 / organism=Chromera_velia_CCMP2878 / gene_product=hypothetical protein / transcript_product=hypothetical protein / location=Cvel_scaffold2622:125-1476(+) / protein_length=340 / sequence_SO=supercontig / SO=protein_coding / is_pseudo=false
MRWSPSLASVLSSNFVRPWAHHVGWILDQADSGGTRGTQESLTKSLGSLLRSLVASVPFTFESGRGTDSKQQKNPGRHCEGDEEREEGGRFSLTGSLLFWIGAPLCAYLGFLRYFLDLSVPLLARWSGSSRGRGVPCECDFREVPEGKEARENRRHSQEEEASKRERSAELSTSPMGRGSTAGDVEERGEGERQGGTAVDGGQRERPEPSYSCFPSPSSARSAALPDHSESSSSAPSQSEKEPVKHFRASPPDPAFEGDGAVFSATPSTDSAGGREVRKRDSLFSISSFEARGGRTEHADEVSDGVVLMLGLCLMIGVCWVLKRLKQKRNGSFAATQKRE